MSTKIFTLMFGMLFAAGTLAAGGTAQAKSVEGLVDVGNADVYTVACTSPKTHCVQIQVCDKLAMSNDSWEQFLILTSPSTLLGDAVDYRVNTPGGCAQTQLICRGAG